MEIKDKYMVVDGKFVPKAKPKKKVKRKKRRKGIKASEETKAKMSAFQKARWEKIKKEREIAKGKFDGNRDILADLGRFLGVT